MKLYHGSNVSIETIDLKRGRKGKDFGQGFYLSADRNQAQMMAERTVDREESGKATLTTFEFDEDILKNHTTMKVKVFEGYSKEWAEFIMMNRRNKTDKQPNIGKGNWTIIHIIKIGILYRKEGWQHECRK